MPPGYRWFVYLIWATSVVVAVALLLMDPYSVRVVPATAEIPLDAFFAPLWLRMILASAVAVLASSATVLTALRRALGGRRRRHAVLFETTLAVSAGFPAFALAADGFFLGAAVAAAALIAIEVYAHIPAARRTRVYVLVLGASVAAAWLPLLAAQLQSMPATGSHTWASMYWFAATFAVFGAYYGLVRGSETRSNRLKFTRRDDLRAGVAWGCIAVMSVLVFARCTFARTLFNEVDAQLWSTWQKGPMAWVIASLVGLLIVAAAVSSSRRPLGRYGSRMVPAAIAAAGAIVLAFSWIAVLVSLVVAAVSGRMYLPDGWIEWYQPVQFAIIVALALTVCLKRFRRTGARVIAWVSAAYLLPVLFLLAFPVVQPDWYRVATSVQIVIVLLAAAAGLAIWNTVVPRRSVAWRVIVRLAVIPFIVVNAGLLLPEVFGWSSRFILIVGAVVSLLFLMPQVAADPRRRALDLIGASSAALLLAVVALLALPSVLREETFTLFGTLWLSVPVMTALVVDLEARVGTSASAPGDATAAPAMTRPRARQRPG